MQLTVCAGGVSYGTTGLLPNDGFQKLIYMYVCTQKYSLFHRKYFKRENNVKR